MLLVYNLCPNNHKLKILRLLGLIFISMRKLMGVGKIFYHIHWLHVCSIDNVSSWLLKNKQEILASLNQFSSQRVNRFRAQNKGKLEDNDWLKKESFFRIWYDLSKCVFLDGHHIWPKSDSYFEPCQFATVFLATAFFIFLFTHFFSICLPKHKAHLGAHIATAWYL